MLSSAPLNLFNPGTVAWHDCGMRTFLDAIDRAMLIAPDAEALVCDGRRLTFRELRDRLERLNGVLSDLGLERGDRVAIISLNSLEMVELYCGIPMAGLVQVPLNFRWAEPEMQYALEDAGARVLICDRDPGPLAEQVEHVIRIDTGEYEAAVTGRAPVPFDAGSEDDLAGLFYTGGTTGASKGVMLTHRNLVTHAWNSQAIVPFALGDRYLVMSPIFHAAGSGGILQCLATGSTQVVLTSFAPGAMLDLVAQERITHTLGVPAMVAATVEEQVSSPRDVSSLRSYAHGGSPIAREIIRRGVEAFPETQWANLYGATETSPGVSGLVNEAQLLDDERGASAGLAMWACHTVIRRPDGTPADTGEAGELTIRGANVMAGYWNKPEQTAAAIRNGWYWTGDIGRIDAEGYLFLLDRSKDMIISGGENVFCTEVEDALYRHPGVLEATVFGVPSEKWGESVHAVVVLREGAAADADELIEHCRGFIAGYKLPRSVSFQTEPLLKSGAGKVLKRELREPYWEGHDTAIV